MPIPNIPNAKKPGTILRTVVLQVLERYNAQGAYALSVVAVQVVPVAFVKDAVDATCVAIGPIRDTPIRIATKPPINLFIIV